MGTSMKRRVYDWVEVVPREGDGRRMDWFDLGMLVLIVANVIAVMVETLPAVQRHAGWSRGLYLFEAASIVAFTVEYVLRLWVCTLDPRYGRRGAVGGRLRFMCSPLAIVDLLAIAPFYLHLLLPQGAADLRFVLALRVLRILRVLKLGRYSSAIATLGRVLKGKREELAVMLLLMAVTLVLASGLMYYAEHEAQAKDGRFTSIPDALWWSVITLTTIGYGDVYPVTAAGRFLGGLIAICGIGFVALPTAIVSSGFAEELARRKAKAPAACPHCGNAIDAPAK